MNLASRDVRYHLGRFVLTAFGLGLLLATVMAMGGIYRGMVEDALSIVRAPGADLWVVQKDTNGPFAETSRVAEDLYRVIRAVSGVRDASPLAFQWLQLRVGAKPIRVQLIGYRLGGLGAPAAVEAGRPILRSRYEMLIDRKAGIPLGTPIRIGRETFTVVGHTEGIVSNAGGPAILAADACEAMGLAVPTLGAELRATLRGAAAAVAATSNPVDLGAGADGRALAAATM